MLLRDPRDEAAWRRSSRGSPRPRRATAPSSPFEPSEALWAELAVGADRCAGRRCPLLSACFAEAARARAAEAELVIANHALYFADVAAGGGVLPEHDAVIFDEAHRLEETAATWLGGRVSRAGLRRLAADIERACREADETVPARALDRVEQAGDRLLRGRVARRPGAAVCARSRSSRRSSSSTRSPRSPASSTAGPRGSTSSPAARSASAAQVEACLEPGALERVVWAEPDAVAWAPVDVSRELRERLWDDGPTADPRLGDADDRRGRGVRPPPPRPRPRPRARRRLAVRLPRAGAALRPADDARSARGRLHRARRPTRCSRCSRCRAGARSCSPRATARSTLLRARVAGRVPYEVLVQGDGAARAAARAVPGRGRLGAARHVDLLAGRRRPRRVALAARDRQAAVLGAGRPAARGALRGGRGGRRRLVPRLRAADGDAPAPAGLRAPDPQPRGPGRRRDPRPAPAARSRTAARFSPPFRGARWSTTGPAVAAFFGERCRR